MRGQAPNKRINLTRPMQMVVSSDRSPRRLCAVRSTVGPERADRKGDA